MFNIDALKSILHYRFNIPMEIMDSALNGEEGLELVKADSEDRYNSYGLPTSYCLILMDCNMPFMDGFDCTQEIRKYFFQEYGLEIRDQPIISAVTGHVESQYIMKCFPK